MDKVILKNATSLICIQGANFIIPLLTLPYLVRVLEPDGFGKLSFSVALIQYFIIFVDYGFNLSGTQKIAIHRDNKKNISKVFWSIFSCKCILCFIGYILLYIVISFDGDLEQIKKIIISSYVAVLGTVLLPIWLFQGKEKMGWIALANITSRLLAIPFIFILVTDKNDTWIAALINGSSSLLAGMISLFFIYKNKWIEKQKLKIRDIKNELLEGWHVFLSTAAVSLYTTTTTVILGIIAGPVAVGYYVSADKLRQASQSLISPISQAFYPRINLLMRKDEGKAFGLIRLLLIILFAITSVISLFLFLGAELLIDVVYGDAYSDSISVLKWLAWLPFIIGFNNVFGVQTLLVVGRKKVFSRILIFSGVVNVFLLFFIVPFLKQDGAAISVFITEILVTLLMLFFIQRYKIPLFRKK